MPSLVSTSALNNLRRVAELGMVTDVTILRRSEVDTDPYGDDLASWTEAETVKGWLRALPAGDLSVAMGYSGVAATFRLFVPEGTNVHARDRVRIGTDEYTVQDTSRESTYRVLLRVMLEKIE